MTMTNRQPVTEAATKLLMIYPDLNGRHHLSQLLGDVEAQASQLSEARTAELVEALRLLRYLWREADIETNVSVANKVRDLFSADDPLAYDIERALAATDVTTPDAERE